MRDAGPVSGPLDIAVDDVGRLHAIADGKYMVRTDGTWRSEGSEPWGGAEISDAKLAASGRGVACAFVVGGKEVSAPGRWDVHAVVIGGPGGAVPLVFPWRSHPSKLVVTRREESSWSAGPFSTRTTIRGRAFRDHLPRTGGCPRALFAVGGARSSCSRGLILRPVVNRDFPGRRRGGGKPRVWAKNGTG